MSEPGAGSPGDGGVGDEWRLNSRCLSTAIAMAAIRFGFGFGLFIGLYLCFCWYDTTWFWLVPLLAFHHWPRLRLDKGYFAGTLMPRHHQLYQHLSVVDQVLNRQMLIRAILRTGMASEPQ